MSLVVLTALLALFGWTWLPEVNRTRDSL